MLFTQRDENKVKLAWTYYHCCKAWGLTQGMLDSFYNAIEKRSKVVANSDEDKYGTQWVDIHRDLRKASLEAVCRHIQEMYRVTRRKPIMSEMLNTFSKEWYALPKLDGSEEQYRTERFRAVVGYE